jgi:hypothetical protein
MQQHAAVRSRARLKLAYGYRDTVRPYPYSHWRKLCGCNCRDSLPLPGFQQLAT